MAWLRRTLESTIGTKVIMAISGLLLFLFLITHLAGNLLTFGGQNAFNTYAANMQSLGPLLWVARIGLLALLVIHVVAALKITWRNKSARPIGYSNKNTVQATYASRTMPMTGFIILFFVLYHLAHFTLYWLYPEYATMVDGQGRHDAYNMLVLGFQNPITSALYIVAMLILGMHLSHGLSSMFQTIGLNHPNINPVIRCAGPCIAWLLVFGFISIPVAVLLGFMKLSEGVVG